MPGMKQVIFALLLLSPAFAKSHDYPMTARVVSSEYVDNSTIMSPTHDIQTGDVTGFVSTDDDYRRVEFEVNGAIYICTGYRKLSAGMTLPARMDNRRIYFVDPKDGKERHYRIRGTRVAP